jgi:hypothetical protein
MMMKIGWVEQFPTKKNFKDIRIACKDLFFASSIQILEIFWLLINLVVHNDDTLLD